MIEFIYQSYAILQKGRAILNLEISLCTVKPGLGKLPGEIREGGLPDMCDPIQLSFFHNISKEFNIPSLCISDGNTSALFYLASYFL